MKIVVHPEGPRNLEEVKALQIVRNLQERLETLADFAVEADESIEVNFTRKNGVVTLFDNIIEGIIKFSPENRRLNFLDVLIKGAEILPNGKYEEATPETKCRYHMEKTRGFLGLGQERTIIRQECCENIDDLNKPTSHNKTVEIYSDGTIKYYGNLLELAS